MRKKVLFTANTLRHIYLCHRPYLKYFKKNGYEVHTATNDDVKLDNVDKAYKLSIKRTPYSLSNIRAIFQLRKILTSENYSIIHTHTPMGAVVTRMAARKSKTKVIYTAHGFHFFKGCPLINYILYFPIEKWLSRYTDMLITINKEDYNFALKHFKTKIKYVPGVGFDLEKFKTILSFKQQVELRNKLGFSKNDYVITYVAEISNRKRHKYLLKVISKMKITNEKFLFVGDDSEAKKIRRYIRKHHLENIVKIVGFNDNVSHYLDISDLVISVSKQEGLPLNIMEAMYKGKPIVVTDCRGNRDLILNNVNGLLVGKNDSDALINAILHLKNDSSLASKLGKKSQKDSIKYSISNIMPKMEKIYREVMRDSYEK